MSSDINKIKDFLGRRNGYLKCGNQRISDALDAEYGTFGTFSLQDIKQAKKEAKKHQVAPEIKPIQTLSKSQESELKNQLEELAKKMGMTLSPVVANNATTQQSLLTKKVNIHAVQTPPLANQVGMHIVLGCNHVPFHNVRMHEGIKELLADYKSEIKGFHLIGDFLDMNTLSSHDKGRFTAVPGLTLDKEYEIGNQILDEYEALLPKKVWKTYLYGNHEDRYNRWMKQMDNAKTPLDSPTEALELWERGYNVKESWSQDFFTLGKYLDIFHGIYFNVHAAKAHMDKLRGSCMFVHTHRIQSYIEGNTGSFNIGACADFNSSAFNYATRGMKSQWQNGFSVVMIDTDGTYHVTQIICQDGAFYFGGKKY
tara:strand:+ start:1583 stop:2689 length:1107 start_codon:yes stop_codon:yes gene_type:complete